MMSTQKSCACLILVACICAVLAAAGCTGTAGTSAKIPPGASYEGPLSSLALAPADLPPGYTQTMAREKNETEVSQLAHESGWQGGYVVMFANGTGPGSRGDIIVQTITKYPAPNIPGIISLIGKQERNNNAMDYADIAVTGLGDTAGSFTGRAKSGTLTIPTLAGSNPITSGAFTNSAEQDLPGQNFAEVYFSKGTFFEVIRMTGPGADAATVTAHARTAYSKIP